MQQFKLNIVNRDKAGRSASRRLRAEGRIPACVYSKGNAHSISLSAVEFRDLRRSISGAALIELVDEKGEKALTHVQEIQKDIIKNNINHIDFYEVERGHAFISQIPVHLVDEDVCVGVRNEGGIIEHKIHSIEIRCLPSELPDFIEVSIKNLSVGGAIHVGDLQPLEGVEYLDNVEQEIVSCQASRLSVATEETTERVDEVPASKVKSDSDSADKTDDK